MASSASFMCEINTPADRVAELVRTALAWKGFRIDFINESLFEITASYHKNERAHGLNWTFEFQAMCSWITSLSGVTVTLQVRELKNEWTSGECQSLCKELLTGIVDRATRLEQIESAKPVRDRYGSARWATHDDSIQAGYVCGIEDSRRLVIGPGEDGNYLTLTPEDTVKHAIVCGPTGSGKTSATFIPNLIERLKTSVIVTEATAGAEDPDLFSKTSYYRKLAGKQNIYYFNPDDLRSDRINPIDAVKSYAQAQALAQLVIDNTTSKNNYGDDVWPKSEANLLTILVAHAAAERLNLGYVRALLCEGPDRLMDILKESRVERVREEYRGFHNNSREGFKYGVFAGLMQRLSLWVNPRVVALTEMTDINLDNLQNELFSFYLAVPSQKGHLKPLAALVFNFLLENVLERHFKHPLYLSLDEFTNFGRIPDIAQKLSIIRHRNIPVVLGVQDFIQLQQVYGKDDATLMVTQPGTKVFFKPRALEVAEKISKMAGMTTVYERKLSSSGHIQEKESGRPLIDPSEVMALDEDQILVFTPKMPPAKTPKFSWQEYESATCLGGVARSPIVVDEELVQTCDAIKRAWRQSTDLRGKKYDRTTKKTKETQVEQLQEPHAPKPPMELDISTVESKAEELEGLERSQRHPDVESPASSAAEDSLEPEHSYPTHVDDEDDEFGGGSMH